MTIDDMRDFIRNHCYGTTCSNCELNSENRVLCYRANDEDTIRENYEILTKGAGKHKSLSITPTIVKQTRCHPDYIADVINQKIKDVNKIISIVGCCNDLVIIVYKV